MTDTKTKNKTKNVESGIRTVSPDELWLISGSGGDAPPPPPPKWPVFPGPND